MKITLTFTGGSRLGDTVVLDLSAPVLVGRSSEAQLKLRDPSKKTSGHHFEIRATASGVDVACLGQRGMKVGKHQLAAGQVAPLAKGALIELPDGSRLRVDDISAPRRGGPAAFSFDDEQTVSPQDRPTETRSTAFIGARDATAATVFGEARGATAATVFGEARGATVTTRHVAPAADAATGPSGVSGEYADSSTFDSLSFGGGETIANETRPGGPNFENEIDRLREIWAREIRFRQKLKALAVCGAVALVGLVVYWRWPTDERWLSHPRPIARHIIRDTAGQIEMTVEYPDNGTARVNPREDGGLEVLTQTGQRWDVEFRLQFDRRRKETAQLRLSLEDAAVHEEENLSKKGYEFSFPEDDIRFAPGEKDGFFFFETTYAKHCQTKTLRGVRFFRKEFVRSEGGRRWHGVLIFFRNGDTVYRLLREIPDGDWERGKWLLRDDPNLALYTTFLNDQWESPGEKALFLDQKRETLRQAIDGRLLRNNPSEWERTGHEIDTLVVMSWNAAPEAREEAHLLLKKFRSQSDVFYRENAHQRRVEGGVPSAAKGAYHNERDNRWFKVNSDKVWL